MKKFYKSLSKAKQSLFVLALTVLSVTAYSQATYTFNYTGAVQTLTLPAGNWGIECWGADGGDITIVSSGGGKGGYSKGEFNVTIPGTTLNILVGGKGVSSAGTTGNPGAGGWNGGGGGGKVSRVGAGGGGASDIRVGGLAATNRIIVAGGGGGAAYYSQVAAGGNGGGQIGQNGNIITSGNVTTIGGGGAGANGAAPGIGGTGFPNTNGTATGGGGGGHSPGIGAGQPGTGGGAGGAGGGSGSGLVGSSGGGGGGYAGGAGGTQTVNVGSGGGGGSGYIGGVSSGSSIAFGQPSFVPSPILTGNGLVIIKELCGISLVASTTNSLNPAICSGQSLTLTTDAISSYTWSTGSNASSITVSPTVTTTYSLTAMSPSNCITSAAITVTVDPAVPNLTVVNTATASSGVCPGTSVTLTASGATSYSWTGGVNNGVVFTPTSAASYTVTGYNACGSSTAVTSVSVHPLPPLVASISQPSVCNGNTVVTLATGAQTYTWSHGAPNGQALYPFATTMYTVVGTSVLNCTAQAMIGVTVETTPILAPIATPTVICMGNSGTVAVSGASNYTWLPVPANNFAGSNNGTITITPTVTATYTVVKANSNCTDTKTITVYVNALPNVFAITSHTVVCAGSSATLSGGGASSYTWTPSSFNLVGNNVVVSPIVATIYTCTGNDGTCTAVYTVAVGTNPVPIIQATASTPSLCVGGSVTLNATGALTYTWNPGGQGAQITDTPLIPTNYIVSGTNIYTCTSQAQVPVIVYPNPTVNAVPNKTLVCLNGPSTITASGANSYVWTTGSLTHTTLVFPPATTVYTVTGTYSNSGCSSSKTVMVQAYTPVTGINGPTAVCIGSGITISSAPANSYTWTVGGNFLSNQASVLISPTVNTTYMLGTTSTSNQVSCVGGNSVNIQVNALPVVTTSAVANRTLICKGESVDIFAMGGLTYVWTFQGNTSLITVTPQAQTTYTVEGTDINGCKNTATITIKLSGCPGFAELSNNASNITVYPNPSSGEFKISAEQNMRLVLINELGQVIREVELNAQNAYSVDIKGLSKGVYFINSKNIEHQFSKKIVVQ